MNHLCVVLDRLQLGYLGCFGNTWTATPAVDRFAAGSALFHRAYADTVDLAEAYESLWRGSHRLERVLGVAPSGPSLVESARAAGCHTLLITDDPTVGGHVAGAAFDDSVVLDPPEGPIEPAATVDVTQTARLFAEALERLSGLPEPFFVWIHAQALEGAWDAPAMFRDRYVDEDDPPAPTFTRLEPRRLSADVDLDERFGIYQAYAGQVTLVDACLGGLLEHLEESGLDARTNLGLLSPRGMPLGEHLVVGAIEEQLHVAAVQVPWLLRTPNRPIVRGRSQALVQTPDWYAAWRELLGSPPVTPRFGCRSFLPIVADDASGTRDRAVVVGTRETGIATPAWYLRTVAADDVAATHEPAADQLFVKPDDFWEASDVAPRCLDVVDGLRQLHDATRAALAAGREPEPLPDDDVLRNGIA